MRRRGRTAIDMPATLTSIVYVSDSPVFVPPLVTIAEILAVSERNNKRDGLTGALLIGAGQFLQFLEGAASDLNRTLERIRHDPRHSNLRILTQCDINMRYFSEWTMVAASLTPDKSDHLTFIIDRLKDSPLTAYANARDLVVN